MSFSERDIQEAFECAVAREPYLQPIEDVEEYVFEHLRGSCPCDLRRCDKCGRRSTNGMPHHTKDCIFERKP